MLHLMIIIYHHSYETVLHLFLPTICSDIAHLYWRHKQWSLSTIIVPAYIYFNTPGCYYFSSSFAHRPEIRRSAESSAVGLVALHCEQCSSFVNNSPVFSVYRSSTILQSSTIPDASIDWCLSNTTSHLHTFLIYVHSFCALHRAVIASSFSTAPLQCSQIFSNFAKHFDFCSTA